MNVWTGFLGNPLAGPFFIQSILSEYKYMELLKDTVDPRTTEILENDYNLTENILTFQHDGAPPLYVFAVRQYINELFPKNSKL